MPPRFALLDEESSDGSGTRVQRFTQDTRITFHADGTYSARDVDLVEGEPRLVTIPAEPHYLIAAEESKLHLQGVVKGKVLIYSPEGIVIEGDLVYAHDPPGTADDFLDSCRTSPSRSRRPMSQGPATWLFTPRSMRSASSRCAAIASAIPVRYSSSAA